MVDSCIDTARIKAALLEVRQGFDLMNGYVCGFDEFNHHMELLFYRSDIFGLAKVEEHARLYSYRMTEEAMSAVLASLSKHSFSM